MMNCIQLSPVKYATAANFSPRGKSDLSKHSRNSCYAFKNGNADILKKFAEHLFKEFERSDIFNDFFGRDVILVPIPRSSLLVAGGLWPAYLIAEELVKVGLGKAVRPYLIRSVAVNKSSGAQTGQRPSIEEQYKSLTVKNVEVFAPKKITLIDDVITKGRTSFASALKLAETFPDSEVRVFAPIRTQGFVENITEFIESAIGNITFDGLDDVNRHP